MKEISAALVKAQRQFGPALKSSTNPHFKSRYADLAACIEAVIDGLNNNGIALIQQTHECEHGVMVETIFVHESGETFSAGKLHVPAQKNDPQGYGSALTYARRYSLMAACGIAPEDDDANAASKKKDAPHASGPGVIKPTGGVFESLDAETQNYLRNVAMDVIALLAKNDVADAYDRIESEAFDADLKTGLWTLLDSTQRSTLKKFSATKKAASYEHYVGAIPTGNVLRHR
jgi:hypothetical protein